MGISKFMVVLIIVSVAFLFLNKSTTEQIINETDSPTVSFFNSTMYEITDKSVVQIMRSNQADIYDTKEELQDATIIVKSEENSYLTNSVSSKNMVKIGDDIFLKHNVNLILEDGTNITTEQMQYNIKTKVAQNSVDFLAKKDENVFSGNSLHLDSITRYIHADKIKMRMKVDNDE